MLRMLATLAFAVSIDLFVTNGKYTSVVWQVANAILQHFGVL